MAEPWASTMSTPNKAIMIKIGHNQNFFLARKNIHISLIIFWCPSKIGSSWSLEVDRVVFALTSMFRRRGQT